MGWEYDGNRSLLSYFASSHDVTPAFLLLALLLSYSYPLVPVHLLYLPVLIIILLLSATLTLLLFHVHSPTLLLPCSCFCCPIAVSNPPEFVQFPSFLFSTPHSPALLLSHSPAVLFSYFLPTLLVSYSYSPAPTLLFLRCDSYSPCP